MDCVVHPFPKGVKDLSAHKDTCKTICPNCYCWVCDDKATQCTDWDSHCLCDGSPEWAIERAKVKRRKEAAKDKAPPPPVDAQQVADRFAHAADVASGGRSDANMTDADKQRQEAQENAHEDENEEELFADYMPLHFEGGQPHPDPIVETTSLSFAALPRVNYTLSDTIKAIKQPHDAGSNKFGGALSRAQLETVSYACQRHAMMLPTGERAGFFLGDGVGLGKGRQLAGVVLENWMRGRKRHIWVSVSADLCVDAVRDLNDIGGGENGAGITVYNITKLPYGPIDKGKKGVTEGVIFCTYSALTSKSQQGTRLDQMIKWLKGGAKEGNGMGCILFDESHKAKHLYPTNDSEDAGNGDGSVQPKKGKRGGGGGKSTQVAKACQTIQSSCPDARVIYCSATGASSLANMAYMNRLGLWGPGTAFTGFEDFEQKISKGGTGAMELVALDMKRRGTYIARQLSFKSATYDTKIIDLTSDQKKMYDAAAQFWSEMHGCFTTALNMLHVGKGFDRYKGMKHPSARVMTHYWGCHQRFFRSLCMAVKVPEVVREIKKALANNKCCVIGLQTTGEARLNDAIKDKDADLEEFQGMQAVVEFLIGKMPTGDYCNKYPESELTDNSDDEDEDEEMLQQAGKQARARQGRLGKKRFGDVRSDEEEDDDLDGFIANDSDEEEEEDDDATDSDEEGSGEDEEEGSQSGETPAKRVKKVKLSSEVRKALKTLTIVQLRQLVRSGFGDRSNAASSRSDVNCTSKQQLLNKLKELEASGTTVHSLLVKAKHITDPNKGKKRPSDEGASSNGRGRPQRLQRTAAVLARKNYVDDNDEEEEEPDVVDVCSLSGSQDEDEEMEDADTTTANSNGLLGKTLDVKVNGVWKVGTVKEVSGNRTKLHHIEFDEDTTRPFNLTEVHWRIHSKSAAPGLQGKASASKRRVVMSEDDDEEEESENESPQKRPSAAAGRRGGAAAGGNKKLARVRGVLRCLIARRSRRSLRMPMLTLALI